MVDVLERSLDPPPLSLLLALRYNSFLFKPGERADKDNPAVDLWVPIAALGAFCPWLAC
jgi:hypothetical protein